jgi:hypothetical protein
VGDTWPRQLRRPGAGGARPVVGMVGKLLCEDLERARNEAGDAIGVRACAAATNQPGEGLQAPLDGVWLTWSWCRPSAAATHHALVAGARPIEIAGPTGKLLKHGGNRVEPEHTRPALAGAL